VRTPERSAEDIRREMQGERERFGASLEELGVGLDELVQSLRNKARLVAPAGLAAAGAVATLALLVRRRRRKRANA